MRFWTCCSTDTGVVSEPIGFASATVLNGYPLEAQALSEGHGPYSKYTLVEKPVGSTDASNVADVADTSVTVCCSNFGPSVVNVSSWLSFVPCSLPETKRKW